MENGQDINKTTNKIANSLRLCGVKSGDVVCVCLPEIQEKEMAKIVCEKLGSRDCQFAIDALNESSLVEKLNASKARVLIIADWCSVDKKMVPSKTIADRASVEAPSLDIIVVVRHLDRSISWLDGRDIWWDALLEK